MRLALFTLFKRLPGSSSVCPTWLTLVVAQFANCRHVKDDKRHIFPFLELSPEVRNQVYQSLLNDYYPHQRGFNPAFENDPAESDPSYDLARDTGKYGTICAKPTRTYEPVDIKAIFRLNKQIRLESLTLAYAAEDIWVVVSIYDNHYVKQLVKAGFPLVPYLDPDKISSPAITIEVLPRHKTTARYKFVLRLVHMRELYRIMKLKVDFFRTLILALFNPLSTLRARDEAHMTELGKLAALLSRLRCVKVRRAKPALSHRQVMLAPLMLKPSEYAPSMTTQGIITFLDSTISEQLRMLARGDFLEAESMITETRAMIRDCSVLDPTIFYYWDGNSYLQEEVGILGVNDTIQKDYAAIIALLMRARYELGKHELVVKHCDFIITDKTIIELPENMLAYTSVYYHRGMSHSALKNYDLAVCDLTLCLASAPRLSLNTDDSLFPKLDYKLLALQELDKLLRI
ncbi:hypothetical protein BDV97DRAFT_405897 [Delphinella strobiligena]|nr:hypothetical protein BDV97DRAFT_405897 [Delphinella strobiligena]